MKQPATIGRHPITPLMEGTAIGPQTARALMLAFVGMIALPLGYQVLVSPAQEWGRVRLLFESFPDFPPRQHLKGVTDAVANESEVARAARRGYQQLLTSLLNEGSQKVVLGHDDYLFLREDLLLCTGTAVWNASDDPLERRARAAEPVSLKPILEFDQQCRDHGIHLVVVPVPVGPVLYPEQIWRGYPVGAGPAWNADYHLWRRRLAEASIDVVDVTDDLWQARGHGPEPWLKNNTHWSPRGVEIAADRIARRVHPYVKEPHISLTTRTIMHRIVSDLAPMLDLLWPGRFPPIPCELTQVFGPDGQSAAGGPDAPVLLLGDSYSYIYNGRDPDDAAGADLGRELMRQLGVPVQTVALKAIDPTQSRVALGFLMPSLSAKKVIVWEFTTRFLQDHNKWKSVPFPPIGPSRVP